MTLVTAAGSSSGESRVKSILDDVKSALKIGEPGTRTSVTYTIPPFDDSSLVFSVAFYREERTPAWTSDTKFVDVANHIILVALKGELAAILFTDSKRANIFDRFLDGSKHMSRLSSGTLNATFASGQTKTLWLSGVHSRTALKADSKVLSGVDLKDALDPVADQTYCFTALRSSGKLGQESVTFGLSPDKSRLWIRSVKDWGSLVLALDTILQSVGNIISSGQSDDQPLALLASTESDTAKISDAYEVRLYPYEGLRDELEPDLAAFLDDWTEHGELEVTQKNAAGCTAKACIGSVPIGDLEFVPDLSRTDYVPMTIRETAEAGEEKRAGFLADLCRRSSCLRVQYESGHVWTSRKVYKQDYREVRFVGWKFRSFKKGGTSYDICKEKPLNTSNKTDLTMIGQSDSLFCWVKNESPWCGSGWLACDDGSGEMADFIHWEHPPGSRPRLTLIHVKATRKGSGRPPSAGMKRQVTVTDYEEVTAQAIKNLRNLDQEILSRGLRDGLSGSLKNLVWSNGAVSTRKAFLAALPTTRLAFDKTVVILQPRTHKATHEAYHQKMANDKLRKDYRLRLLQLETLLVNAASACQSMSANLVVIADGT